MNIRLATVLFIASGSLGAAEDNEKITFEDHVRPMLENKCFSCHNPDKKKGDLDLTTFAATMTGGAGGAVVDPGNPDGSRLWTTTTKKEEPFMPPEGSPLGEKDVELLVKWINGGVLETKSSLSRKSDRPKVDLTVAVTSGKPEGPPAMPEHVLLEPVLVTPRASTVTAMAASPWGPLLAIAGQKQILLYDTDKGVLAGVLPYEEGYAQSLRFSRNGSLLILGGGRGGKFGHAVVWDVKSGRRVTEVGKEFDSVMSADISPDQKIIVIGSPSKKVKCYDTATGEELYMISKHTEWVLSTAFSPDGILLSTADRNGNVMVWEAANGGEFHQLGQHKAACVDLAWRGDSNVLATCSLDGTVAVWEMTGGKQLKSWPAHGGGVLSVSFTPDGKLLSAGKDGLVRLWDINGNKLGEAKSQGDLVTKVVALHDGKTAVTGNWRGEVLGWNLADFAQRGAYSSNPPLIAQRIVEADKLASELDTSLVGLHDAAIKAKAPVAERSSALETAKKKAIDQAARKALVEAELKDLPAKLATLDKALKEAQSKRASQAETLKKHGELTAQLPPAEAALAELKKAREALQNPEQKAEIEEADKKIAAGQGGLDDLKKALATEPAPMAGFDEGIKKAEEALKATQAAKPVREKELADLAKAVEAAPKELEAATKALADSKSALAAAEAAIKAQQSKLAFYQKLPITLRAAQFNVSVLTEKEKLAVLEADVNANASAVKDIETKSAAASQRLDSAKQSLAKSTQLLPQQEAAAKKINAELSAQDQAMAPSRETLKEITSKAGAKRKEVEIKQAELDALIKQRDGEVAKAKKAADDVFKSLADLKKKLGEVSAKLAAPQKTADNARASLAQAEAAHKAAAETRKKQEAALTAANQDADKAESQLKQASAAKEAVSQDVKQQAAQALAKARQAAQSADGEVQKAKAAEAAETKKAEEVRMALAAASKAVDPLRGQHASLSKEIEAQAAALVKKQAQVPVVEQGFAGKLKPLQDNLTPLQGALAALDGELKAAQEKLAGEQKVLDSRAAELARANETWEASKKQRMEAEATIATVTKEIPSFEESLKELKAELAVLTPQVEPLKQKVRQLEEQYLGMLPK